MVQGGEERVVETDDRHVARDADAVVEAVEDARGDEVVRREDRGREVGQQRLGSGDAGLLGELAGDDARGSPSAVIAFS